MRFLARNADRIKPDWLAQSLLENSQKFGRSSLQYRHDALHGFACPEAPD